MSNPKPTVGRIVLYTLSTGEVRPAIVVRSWDDNASYPPGTINVQVFLDGRNDSAHKTDDVSPRGKVHGEECIRGVAWRTSVHQAKTETGEPGCWHWPAREESTASAA